MFKVSDFLPGHGYKITSLGAEYLIIVESVDEKAGRFFKAAYDTDQQGGALPGLFYVQHITKMEPVRIQFVAK